MKVYESTGGFTLVDLLNVMILMGVVLGLTALLGRRVVSGYQLNAAAQALASDLSRAQVRAIQTNTISKLRRESDQAYRAAESPRELPGPIRFSESSADSVAFNGLGAVVGGAIHTFVLIDPYGESREVRIYPAGGREVRKL